MSAFKTYKGGRLDLEHYKGMTVYFYAIDLYNEDGTEASLSAYQDIRIKIYEKQHGTLVADFDFQTGVSVDSPANNTIYWNATITEMNLRPKLYYHECTGLKNVNPLIQELLFSGVSQVI
jgi:hypothetical protein